MARKSLLYISLICLVLVNAGLCADAGNDKIKWYKDLLQQSQDNYDLLYRNFTNYRTTQEQQTTRLLRRLTSRIEVYKKLQDASYNTERKLHELYQKHTMCMGNLTGYIQKVNQQSIEIDALNVEIDSLMTQLANCMKARTKDKADCGVAIKDCDDSKKKLGLCMTGKKKCDGDLNKEKAKGVQCNRDKAKCADDLKNSQDSTKKCEDEKSKQMGDINSLKKSLSDAKDELEKCKKASDTCKNERKNDANVLKKCKQDSKQCQDSVNNLNKLAKKAKQDGANHDECKKKLQQAENMILKTMALTNCAAWKAKGQPSGEYLIDPDGDGKGIQPFKVYCKFSGNKVETLVKNSSPAPFASKRVNSKCKKMKDYGTDVTPYSHGKRGKRSKNKSKSSGSAQLKKTLDKGYCQAQKYTYDLTDDQIKALKSVSTSCSQKITWKCYDQSAMFVFSQEGEFWGKHREWWPHFYSFTPSSPMECECADQASCLNNKGCNCYTDDTNWQSDTISFDDKDNLPLTQIVLGDLDNKNEQAKITVDDDDETLQTKSTMPSLLSNLKKGVVVERDADIQAARMKLPILGEEQQIIETISENMVTIICGETGSGKTTQVPQFLYEAGYTSDGFLIGVTEPRRVAAISMSKRVAQELNMTESQVSYQIRYEGNATPQTCIKFMTDGVLLKEIQNDFLLDKYRVVIIDEAHERSVYTDVLIGLLSRIVSLRHKKGRPLKMVIMSATLRVEDFRDNRLLFPVPPPVLKIDSRQFPVTIHFNKRTPEDYLTDTFKKICKVHRKLPAGGILVFVTGKQEVHTLCKKLQRTFPSTKQKLPATSKDSDATDTPSAGDNESANDKPAADTESDKESGSDEDYVITKSKRKRKQSASDADASAIPEIKLDSYSALPMDEQAELEPEDSDIELDLDSEEESGDDDADVAADKVIDYEQKRADQQLPLYVLPLYSLLNTKRQALVFEPPPEGCRLCVVSTNVAETSLTIPNVKYVIDCGKTKNKFYDKVTGVSTFRVTFASQASANQRAGRAGRTGPGHCYRLYSSSVFTDEFEKFSPPEIVSRPVDDLILQMKSMGIEKVINFPFPTPPSEESLLAGQDLLVKLGALSVTKQPLSRKKRGAPGTTITNVGKVMSKFPVAPRYGKMLSLAHQKDLLVYVIAIVAACSVQELFMEGSLTAAVEGEELIEKQKKLAKQKSQWAGKGQSQALGDVMVSLKAVGAAEYMGCTPEFCEQNNIRFKAICEIRKLRVQLTNIVNSVLPTANICVDPKMSPPTEEQARMIRQIMLAGLQDRVARLNIVPNDAEADTKKRMRNSYQSTLVDDYCYIHPTSVLNKRNHQYVIYQDIMEANNKVYLRGVTSIEPEWIPKYAPIRCTFSEPLESPEPRYDPQSGTIKCHMSSTFGAHLWQLPTVELPYPNKVDKYRYFAKCLLEGAVCKKMKRITNSYLASPSIMIKSWARLQPRTESLLKALYSAKICDKQALMQRFIVDNTYLLSEILEWLPESEHEDVRSTWPPVKLPHKSDEDEES